MFCFIYIWTNTLFCFSNFLLNIFTNLTNLLVHNSKKVNSLLLQLFQNWANTRVIFLSSSIILNIIFSNFIIFVWLLILCSQGWSSTILNLTNFFFGTLSCFKHLLNNSVICLTCFVLCCSLWGWRSQVERLRLKFEGVRSKVIMLGLSSESLFTLLGLRLVCKVWGYCL